MSEIDGYCRHLASFFFVEGMDRDDLFQEARLAAWLAPAGAEHIAIQVTTDYGLVLRRAFARRQRRRATQRKCRTSSTVKSMSAATFQDDTARTR